MPDNNSEKLNLRLPDFFPDEKRPGRCETDAASTHSVSGSSSESVSGAPSRLVPGHRVWANRNGRHVLGLVEDYSALRRQISEGRKLSRGMTSQLQECLHVLRQLGSDNQVEFWLSPHPSPLLAASLLSEAIDTHLHVCRYIGGHIRQIFPFFDKFFFKW